MNTDGTARTMTKLHDATESYFNHGDNNQLRDVASAGDLDGDGVPDLIVGEVYSDVSASNEGAAWILFLKIDGTVKHAVNLYDNVIPDNTWAANYYFGSAVEAIGDVDGDGVQDIAVGVY